MAVEKSRHLCQVLGPSAPRSVKAVTGRAMGTHGKARSRARAENTALARKSDAHDAAEGSFKFAK